MHIKPTEKLWIFGYGSLIWNPGFEFSEARVGYAIGFARRMYQGNTYHRGDDLLPGRVATLVKQSSSITNGIAFLVKGEKNVRKAFEHLREREVDNGYEFCMVPLQVEENGVWVQREALTCIATTSNPFYLGPDDVTKMADNIRTAKGCAGTNCEYVLKLAAYVRLLFPDDDDDHLFELERSVLNGSRPAFYIPNTVRETVLSSSY